MSLVISKSITNQLSKQWSHNQWTLSAHWFIFTIMNYFQNSALANLYCLLAEYNSKLIDGKSVFAFHCLISFKLLLKSLFFCLLFHSIPSIVWALLKSLFFCLLRHSTAFIKLQLDRRSTLKYLETGEMEIISSSFSFKRFINPRQINY